MPKIIFQKYGIDLVLSKYFYWTIRWYGIAYIISYFIVLGRIKRYLLSQSIQITPWEVDRLAEYSFIFGIIGGRLWYLIERFVEDGIPISYRPFHVWEGGMGFQGGLILGAIAGITYCFSIKKERYIALLLDLIMANIPIAIMIGRIGNFLNYEFMNLIPIQPNLILMLLMLVMYYSFYYFNYVLIALYYLLNIHVQVIYIPQSIFAALTEGALAFVIINIYFKYTINYKYLTTTVFGMAYSSLRFINDIFRDEPFVMYSLRLSQIICIILFILSLIGFVYLKIKQLKSKSITKY